MGPPGTIRLSSVLSALSHALDLTEGHPSGHTTRTCLIGMRLTRALGLSVVERSTLFYALLLKDAGVLEQRLPGQPTVRRRRPVGQTQRVAARLADAVGPGDERPGDADTDATLGRVGEARVAPGLARDRERP